MGTCRMAHRIGGPCHDSRQSCGGGTAGEDAASDAAAGQRLSQAELAALLADSAAPGPDAVMDLPLPVVAALGLDRHWMVARFPHPEAFVDVTGL